jgi:hypothetical protein
MTGERLVFAYCDGTIFSFERMEMHSVSVFGGPMEATWSTHSTSATDLIREQQTIHYRPAA